VEEGKPLPGIPAKNGSKNHDGTLKIKTYSTYLRILTRAFVSIISEEYQKRTMGSKPKREKQKRKNFLFFPSLGGEGEGKSAMRALTPYSPPEKKKAKTWIPD